MPTIAEAKEIYDASEKTDADIEAFKTVFETYFDIKNLIDYQIFSDVSILFLKYRCRRL